MQVYADNAATTKMSAAAIAAMMPCFDMAYANPSSLHTPGQEAKELLEAARAKVAAVLGCEAREIYFTSGGSEADNQAIISAARLGQRKGKMHIISTAFEHHAVLHTLQRLQKEGFEITLLDVKEGHNVTAQQVKDAIREDTCLVTCMYANNEIGSVLPIAEIGAVCKEAGVLFHTDAVQAVGHLKIDVKKDGAEYTFLLEGRLDTITSPDLESKINEVIGDAAKLTLDLSKLEYISSAGLRVLLGALQDMEGKGEMVICNLTQSVHEVFELTGFARLFNIE